MDRDDNWGGIYFPARGERLSIQNESAAAKYLTPQERQSLWSTATQMENAAAARGPLSTQSGHWSGRRTIQLRVPGCLGTDRLRRSVWVAHWTCTFCARRSALPVHYNGAISTKIWRIIPAHGARHVALRRSRTALVQRLCASRPLGTQLAEHRPRLEIGKRFDVPVSTTT